MTTRQARWAGVEFQPDLKKPVVPVRLGLVLHEANRDGDSSIVVIGRMPRIEARPDGFENTSPTMMEIASKWVEVMGRDIPDDLSADVLSQLAEKWHWNLYVIEPIIIRLASTTELVSRAKRLYRTFVGVPFSGQKAAHKPKMQPTVARSRVTPPQLPPPWMLREMMQHAMHAGH